MKDVRDYREIGTDPRWGELWITNLTTGAGSIPSVNGDAFFTEVPVLGNATNTLHVAIPDRAGNMGYATKAYWVEPTTNGTNQTKTYAYDSAGGNTNSLSLHWDERYRLTSVTTTAAVVNYSYDVLGRRTSRTANGATEHYLYEGRDVLVDLYGSSLRPHRVYAHGAGIDNILTMTVYSDSYNPTATTYHYIKDHQNSVIALTDSSGTVVETYQYDAYGNTRVFDASGTELTASAYGNRYTFQGREIDWATGLYYFRARWYDPEVGRWLSKDSIGISGGLNQYVFVGNNPVNFVDPLGFVPASSEAVISERSELVDSLVSEIQSSDAVSDDISHAAGTANVSYVNNDSSLAGTGITQGPFGGGTYDISSNPWTDGGADLTPEGLAELVNTIIHELLHESGVGQTGAEHPSGFYDRVRRETKKFMDARADCLEDE